MKYVEIEFCKETVFPFIHNVLSNSESSPIYVEEQYGMDELKKVLEFVKNDEYYTNFWEKGAYLLCSIAGSQYFSNGNKRLGVSVLLAFLTLNQASIVRFSEPETYRNALLNVFPDLIWEENTNIENTDALFLYNLALAVATNNFYDFPILKSRITDLLSIFCKLEN